MKKIFIILALIFGLSFNSMALTETKKNNEVIEQVEKPKKEKKIKQKKEKEKLPDKAVNGILVIVFAVGMGLILTSMN